AQATGRHAADLVSRGMKSVLVNGTTGEAGTLTDDERIELLKAVRAAILAGTGGASTEVAVGLTKAALDAGADVMLAYPPPGYADAAELHAFHEAVATAADGKPVLAYHVPWVSSPGVPVEDLPNLTI